MGYHVSWITVQGKAPDVIRSELGLSETDERECVPESEVSGVLLPSGWYVVFFNEPMPAQLTHMTLSSLSRGGELMMFVVEEGSMVSLARGYTNGAEMWEISHDANQGLEHLSAEGYPPAQFLEVRSRLMELLSKSAQGVDYLFDVPAELSKVRTGFRHDQDIDGIEGDAFTVLERK